MSRLRAEASVLNASALTAEQSAAGEQLYTLLSEMATSSDEVDAPMPSFLPRIDRHRSNRVILIDGERGSGKTTLLITLIHLWRLSALNQPPQELKEPLKRWATTEGRIIPFGLLDLHPLPPSTNLLLHIIGRFERVVEWLEDGHRAERRPAWHPPAPDGELKSRTRWQALLRAVAAGWDGNAEARWSRLDLEAYTLELEESERQRLNLVETFTGFIDALAEDYRAVLTKSATKKPLFVLAVDDADMNPERSVELLDTVRMLWHPRVAFILTGDSGLFIHQLTAHCRKQLRGGGKTSAQALAIDIYDKVVPSGHRCTLHTIPPTDRLRYHVGLKQLLERLHVGRVTESRQTLLSYFEREEQLAEALPDRLRGLIDLSDQCVLELNPVGTGANTSIPASRVVEYIWKRALDRASRDYESIRDLVHINDHTGALSIREIHPIHLDRPSPQTIASLAPREVTMSDSGADFAVLRAPRLDAELNGTQLARPVTGALMLASEVVVDQDDGRRDSHPSDHTGYEELFAVSTHRLGGRYSWPVPPGYPFSFYAAFHSRWKIETAHVNGKTGALSRGEVDDLAQRFIFLVLRLTMSDLVPKSKRRPESWTSLAELVAAQIARGRTRARFWALRRAGLLAAPEFGLSVHAANEWLSSLLEVTDPKALREALSTERRRALENATGRTDVERLARSIDEASRSYKWVSAIEEAPLSSGPIA